MPYRVGKLSAVQTASCKPPYVALYHTPETAEANDRYHRLWSDYHARARTQSFLYGDQKADYAETLKKSGHPRDGRKMAAFPTIEQLNAFEASLRVCHNSFGAHIGSIHLGVDDAIRVDA